MWVFSFLISVPIVSLRVFVIYGNVTIPPQTQITSSKNPCVVFGSNTILSGPSTRLHPLPATCVTIICQVTSLSSLFRCQPSSWTQGQSSGPDPGYPEWAWPAPHSLGSSPTFLLASHPRASRCNSAATLTYHLLITVPGSGTHLGGCCGHCPPLIHSVNIYLGEDPWASLTASPVYSLRSLCDLCVNLSSWLFLFPPLFTFCLLLLVPLSGRAPPSLISSFRVFSVLSSPFS